MWELLQITILQTNSEIVGIHSFRKFFLLTQNSCYLESIQNKI
ncbi:hypothetical protein LEP1GSC021_2532 [Leptospira noguchii str. 1993005606]|nr:hypothetical protein LEP1GSC021_2532 [Leptospira noguchii str. 1993005606]